MVAFILTSAVALVFLIASPVTCWDQQHGGKSRSNHGAVASESLVCSKVGGDILRAGGSAADAMVATVLCVGTIDAHHSGIGGGGFALVRDNKGRYEMVDFRETAPALANETMYSNNTNPTASTVGGLAVGVPGELRGLEIIHQKYGKLPWKDLFAPAIKIARDGFVVQPQLAGVLQQYKSEFLNNTAFRAVYAPNGTIAVYGDVVKRPTYAKTLEVIAEKGTEAFYDPKSYIAQTFVNSARKAGGIITLKDLAGYKALTRTPEVINYRGKYKIVSTVAPSSGTVVLSALNIFGGYNSSLDSYIYDPKAAGGKRDSNETAHLLIESMKFAYGQREVLGDPAFVKNVSSLEKGFIQPSVGAEIRKKIKLGSTLQPASYDPSGYSVPQDHGTSQLVAADNSGMVISLTTTVNLYFGSRIMVPETGVVLNDEMDDFSSPGSSNAFGYIATPSNYIVPGKRPLSSISNTLVEDLKTGSFVFATGAAGGSRIITANFQNVHHYLDQGLSAEDAIKQPRIHDQIYPQTTTFEWTSLSQNVTGYNNATVAFLASVGHNVSWVAPGVSVSASIGQKNGKFDPAADPRILGSGSIVV